MGEGGFIFCLESVEEIFNISLVTVTIQQYSLQDLVNRHHRAKALVTLGYMGSCGALVRGGWLWLDIRKCACTCGVLDLDLSML